MLDNVFVNWSTDGNLGDCIDGDNITSDNSGSQDSLLVSDNIDDNNGKKSIFLFHMMVLEVVWIMTALEIEKLKIKSFDIKILVKKCPLSCCWSGCIRYFFTVTWCRIEQKSWKGGKESQELPREMIVYCIKGKKILWENLPFKMLWKLQKKP